MNYLLITYTFPPTTGIGGRRWAKFAKEMTNEGDNFFVVHSKSSIVAGDFWSQDIFNNKRIVRFPIRFRWNSVLANPSPRLYQKVLYRFLMFFIRRSKLDPYDNTAFAIKQLVKVATKIIAENKIDVILLSGPPHALNYCAVDLKKIFKQPVIIDYRDLWNGHPTYFKFQDKTSKQKNYTLYQEKVGLKVADAVFAVNESICKKLIELNDGNDSNKFFTIPNGFDRDDFFLEVKKTKSEKIRLFFAGNIAIDSEKTTEEFIRSFMRLKVYKPEIYHRFVLEFYVKTESDLLRGLLKECRDKNFIFVNDFLSKDDYYKKLREIDFGMMILTKVYSDAFITKFSDYILNDIGLLQIGYPGEFADFLKKTGLGKTHYFEGDNCVFEDLIGFDVQEAYGRFDKSSFDVLNISKKIRHVSNRLLNLL